MQTLQFARAMDEILDKMKTRELRDFIGSITVRQQNLAINDPMRDQFSTLVMASQVGYAQLTEHPNTKAVLESLKINEIYSPERLGRLIRYLGSVQASSNLIANAEYFAEFFSIYSALE